MNIFTLLSDIENVSRQELDQRRLNTLLHGFNSFDQVLQSRADLITVDKRFGKPYRIIDGRHRIFLARQKGYRGIFIQPI